MYTVGLRVVSKYCPQSFSYLIIAWMMVTLFYLNCYLLIFEMYILSIKMI